MIMGYETKELCHSRVNNSWLVLSQLDILQKFQAIVSFLSYWCWQGIITGQERFVVFRKPTTETLTGLLSLKTHHYNISILNYFLLPQLQGHEQRGGIANSQAQ